MWIYNNRDWKIASRERVDRVIENNYKNNPQYYSLKPPTQSITGGSLIMTSQGSMMLSDGGNIIMRATPLWR